MNTTTPRIPPYHRLPQGQLRHIVLEQDDHPERGARLSPMEAVAWMAGLPHTGYPDCVPVRIQHFVFTWTTYLPVEDLNRLIAPILPMLVGPNLPDADQRTTAMPANWLLGTATPSWLEAAGLDEQAHGLRSLTPFEPTQSGQIHGDPDLNRTVQQAARAAWETIEQWGLATPDGTPPSVVAAASGTIAAAATSTRPNIAALSLVCSHAALVATQRGTDIHAVKRTLQRSAATLLRDMALETKDRSQPTPIP